MGGVRVALALSIAPKTWTIGKIGKATRGRGVAHTTLTRKLHARGTIARTLTHKMIGAATRKCIAVSNTRSVATSALHSWSHSIARMRLTIGRLGPSTRKHIVATRLA